MQQLLLHQQTSFMLCTSVVKRWEASEPKLLLDRSAMEDLSELWLALTSMCFLQPIAHSCMMLRFWQ